MLKVTTSPFRFQLLLLDWLYFAGVSGCMAEITKASKAGNVDAISSSATITAELLSEAIQAASQAVYLIGLLLYRP
jgi:hypothetical protein